MTLKVKNNWGYLEWSFNGKPIIPEIITGVSFRGDPKVYPTFTEMKEVTVNDMGRRYPVKQNHLCFNLGVLNLRPSFYEAITAREAVVKIYLETGEVLVKDE